jgi:hypothetical protein
VVLYARVVTVRFAQATCRRCQAPWRSEDPHDWRGVTSRTTTPAFVSCSRPHIRPGLRLAGGGTLQCRACADSKYCVIPKHDLVVDRRHSHTPKSPCTDHGRQANPSLARGLAHRRILHPPHPTCHASCHAVNNFIRIIAFMSSHGCLRCRLSLPLITVIAHHGPRPGIQRHSPFTIHLPYFWRYLTSSTS